MTKPKVIVSKCFSYPVRYNGGIVHDEFIEKLKRFVDYKLVCPEIAIGLGVPRQRLIIQKIDSEKHLFQPETNKYFTEEITEWTKDFIKSVKEVDGFLLKSKSPSCGIASANLYVKDKIAGRTDGFFAEAIKERFPFLPLEHEGRLKNSELRDHFLIRVFAFADFRQLKKEGTANDLVKFHTSYKYLLMTYNQKMLQELGRLVADGRLPLKEKIAKYEINFYRAFGKRPSRARHYNTLQHIFGHFKAELNQREKSHFLNLLKEYLAGDVELRILIEILNNFAFRFDNEYLLNQRYINPFPKELTIY
ncbi:MAG: YbgA family protein [bacterium]